MPSVLTCGRDYANHRKASEEERTGTRSEPLVELRVEVDHTESNRRVSGRAAPFAETITSLAGPLPLPETTCS